MFFCHYYWKFFYGTKGTTYQSSDQNVIHKSRYWRVFGVPVYVNIFQTKIKWKNLFIPPCFKLDTTAMESFHEIHLIRVLYSTTLLPYELNNHVWIELIRSRTAVHSMVVQPVVFLLEAARIQNCKEEFKGEHLSSQQMDQRLSMFLLQMLCLQSLIFLKEICLKRHKTT